VPGRAKWPAVVEKTRSRCCGQDPVRKGDEVHRVSRQCEVATRVSPGSQLAHHRESAAAASCRKQVWLTGRKLRQLVQIQIVPSLGYPTSEEGARSVSAMRNHIFQTSARICPLLPPLTLPSSFCASNFAAILVDLTIIYFLMVKSQYRGTLPPRGH
jgi:hypothetical protein